MLLVLFQSLVPQAAMETLLLPVSMASSGSGHLYGRGGGLFREVA